MAVRGRWTVTLTASVYVGSLWATAAAAQVKEADGLFGNAEDLLRIANILMGLILVLVVQYVFKRITKAFDRLSMVERTQDRICDKLGIQKHGDNGD